MINFQGVQGGVGYNDTASDQDSRRRQQLAQLMLQQSNATPAVGWTGALNKVLAGAIAGYQMNKDGEEQKARGDARNDTLARALQAGQGQAAETKSYGDGTTINWDERKGDPNRMAAILMGNRDTSGMGMQMQVSQMDEKRKNEAAATAALLKRQSDREDEFYKPIKTEDGSIIVPAMTPGFQMPGQAPRAPVPAPQAPGGGVDMRTASAAPNPPPVEQQAFSHTPGYATQVTGVENGTGNPAARNPRSSAMGNGQFIDATWLDIVKRNRPDIAQGKSDQDILALRADPKLSAEMTDVYGMENADFLRAGGIQSVGNAEKYAAHFFGPTGAIKVLQADPNASFASVLSPEVIKANPQLARMTVGQWRDQNAAKFGGGAQPAAAPPQVQASDQASLGRLADASGAIPQSALPPGVLYRPNNTGGGMFPGKTNEAAAYNTYRALQGKISRGEQLTGDEQFDLQIAQQVLTQPKTVMTDQGLQSVAPPPLPTRNAPQASPAQAASTGTVPNPLQATDTPAPVPQPNQPTVTTIQKKTEKPSNEQNLNAGFANRLNSAQDALDELDREGYSEPSNKDRLLDRVPGVNNYLTSDNFQKLELAQRNFITAQLRRESGAAISQSEFEEAKKLYFPQPGEGSDIVAKKRAIREMAIANMAQSAGPAELGFKPKPAPKAGDKPATPTTIMRFDAEGNIVQ